MAGLTSSLAFIHGSGPLGNHGTALPFLLNVPLTPFAQFTVLFRHEGFGHVATPFAKHHGLRRRVARDTGESIREKPGSCQGDRHPLSRRTIET